MDGPTQLWGANTAYLSRFEKAALMEIKKRNDKEGGRREWLANVYEVDGKYSLGEPTYGNYSGILVSPSGVLTKDINVCKLNGGAVADTKTKSYGAGETSCDKRPQQLVATVHMHPIRTFAEEARRQHFSGVDIASEFVKSRDEDKEIVLFLTYPNLHMTQRSNRVKAIIFPGKDVVMKAMQESNPGVNPAEVTVENRDKVDWIKFQSALQDMGYIEEVEIEGATGAPPSTSLDIIGGMILLAVGIGGFLLWRHWKKQQSAPVDEV